MSEISFEKKLEIAAKAFFRDEKNTPDYPHLTWESQRDEMRENTSKEFIETCYKWNKDDPELNTEISSLN